MILQWGVSTRYQTYQRNLYTWRITKMNKPKQTTKHFKPIFLLNFQNEEICKFVDQTDQILEGPDLGLMVFSFLL